MTAISSSVSGSGAFCLVTSCTLVTPALGTPASGVATNITGLVATNLASGTVPAARMPALTGDVTSSVGTVATILASTAVTPATYGDATHVAQVTVDQKGRITGAASVSITAPTVDLASGVTGVLPPANGGAGALHRVPSNGFLPIGNGTTYTSAALTGTTSQVIVTNGAGSVTLALPQSIATTSSPHFACVGAGTGCTGSEVINYTGGQTAPGYVAAGNCGAALTLNWNSGGIQTSHAECGHLHVLLRQPDRGESVPTGRHPGCHRGAAGHLAGCGELVRRVRAPPSPLEPTSATCAASCGMGARTSGRASLGRRMSAMFQRLRASKWTWVVGSLLAGMLGILLVQTIQHLKADHDNLHVLVQEYLMRHQGGK